MGRQVQLNTVINRLRNTAETLCVDEYYATHVVLFEMYLEQAHRVAGTPLLSYRHRAKNPQTEFAKAP